jgi:GNAT superfamily N-acetyltransferase
VLVTAECHSTPGPLARSPAPTKLPKAVCRIARAALRKHFAPARASDDLQVECETVAVQISYVASDLSMPRGEATTLELRCHFDSLDMWIRELHVAAPFRSRGLGTDLVMAAESIASALGMRAVQVLPLSPARRFWSKMGYVPQKRTARVLVKRLQCY